MRSDALRCGRLAVESVVRSVDLEARGVQDVCKLILGVPALPGWFARVLRDVIVALSEMRPQEAGRWSAFHDHFADVHQSVCDGK